MATNPIQWFPGHMAKTRRVMKECLPEVDLVLELLDARIPRSSRNPEIEKMLEGKPRLTVLTKASLADPDVSARFAAKYNAEGTKTVVIDVIADSGIKALSEAVRELMADKLARYKAKGMEGRKLRAMIVGIPNVGKSSLINRLSSTNKAKVENRPGVTLNKQWITTSLGIDLLDMPGILWPKFDDQKVGENLALTGAIRDEIMDIEMLACVLAGRLRERYADLLVARYKLKPQDLEDTTDFELAELIGRRRGFLISGGEVDFLRTSNMFLDEFRGGKIGKITIEMPE